MIGKNIQRIRAQNGITLSELAERAGISKSYLSSIERNVKQNPSIQVMEKIAFVLNVDLKALLRIDTDQEKQQMEKEWLDFVDELKNSGIDKSRVNDYKILIEFIRWHQRKTLAEKNKESSR